MNCKHFNNFLEHHMDSLLDASVATDMEAHGRNCANCGKSIEQAKALRSQLRALKADTVPEGLNERTWQGVWQKQNRKKQFLKREWTPVALAASLVLALLFMVIVPASPELDQKRDSPVVHLKVMEKKNLQLLFTNEEADSEAVFTINLPQNVYFQSPGQRVARWTAELRNGKNLLSIPVTATDHVDDLMTTRVTVGEKEHVFQLHLSAVTRI